MRDADFHEWIVRRDRLRLLETSLCLEVLTGAKSIFTLTNELIDATFLVGAQLRELASMAQNLRHVRNRQQLAALLFELLLAITFGAFGVLETFAPRRVRGWVSGRLRRAGRFAARNLCARSSRQDSLTRGRLRTELANAFAHGFEPTARRARLLRGALLKIFNEIKVGLRHHPRVLDAQVVTERLRCDLPFNAHRAAIVRAHRLEIVLRGGQAGANICARARLLIHAESGAYDRVGEAFGLQTTQRRHDVSNGIAVRSLAAGNHAVFAEIPVHAAKRHLRVGAVETNAAVGQSTGVCLVTEAERCRRAAELKDAQALRDLEAILRERRVDKRGVRHRTIRTEAIQRVRTGRRTEVGVRGVANRAAETATAGDAVRYD